MPIKYIIEGNTVTKVEEISRDMVSLDGLLPGLTSYVPLELSPIPAGLKYIVISPKDGLDILCRVVVQVDPGYQRITYKDGPARTDEPRTSFRIPLPYNFFWFELNGSRMVTPTGENILWSPKNWGLMWGKEPFTTLEGTRAYPARLPNCWTNGTICFGSTNVNAALPLGQFIDTAINSFWTSEFNADLDRYWPYLTMTEWQDAGSENEEVWKDWGMWEADGEMTMKDKLNALIDRYSDNSPQWREAVPSSAREPIPALRITPTWYNLNEWLDDLNAEDYDRLRTILNARD